MTKTPEEIYEYVLDYKNRLLNAKDEEKTAAFNQANDANNRLVTQLILTSTVFLTVIGGLVTTSSSRLSNGGVKVLLTLAILSLVFSVCSGLVHLIFTDKFFTSWGEHLHTQGAIIKNDQSRTVEELEVLLERLDDNSLSMPMKSPEFFFTLQVFTYVSGVIFTLSIVIVKIYS